MRNVLLLLLILIGCKTRYAGMLPMYLDEYIGTTESRTFLLENSLVGKVILFQPSYDCLNDSITNNSTAIVKLTNEDTVTVYSPCLQRKFEPGADVVVQQIDLSETTIQQFKREILHQFPKGHPNYPYWECISCKYPNTVGIINAR